MRADVHPAVCSSHKGAIGYASRSARFGGGSLIRHAIAYSHSVRRLRAPSPFQRVILGLVLGVAVGLFFGEPAGVLSIGGDAYIRLLQMTVLPYVIVSLVAGLGGLDANMARRIGLRAAARSS